MGVSGSLAAGLYDVPPGHVAAVVTYLEMTAPPRPTPLPPSPLRLARWDRPALPAYRTLFLRVGAPWLWCSRAAMDDARLARIIHDPGLRIWAVTDRAGIEVGLIELDYRQDGACELSFFGLIPALTGKGHGRWLMALAVQTGWAGLANRPAIRRLWLHSCTLDHPAALGFYQAQGFAAYARRVEIFADPRATGLLAADCAPRFPCL